MAECSPSGQYSLGSAEDFDFVCSLCRKKKATKEAECYCKVCCQYFCITCKDFHSNLMPHHDDLLIARAELNKHGQLPTGPALTDTCERHTGKLIELFCGAHLRVGCSICMAIDHKSCKTEYIPDMANGKHVRPELKILKTDLEKAKKDVIDIQINRRSAEAKLKSHQAGMVANLRSRHQRLEEIVKQLEKTTVDSIHYICENFIEELNEGLQTLDDVLIDMEGMLKSIDNADDQSEAQLFVMYYKYRTAVSSVSKLCQDLKDRQENKDIRLIIDESIEKGLKEYTTLGRITLSPTLRAIEKQTKVNIRATTDQRTCSIAGTCIVDKEYIMMADCANFKIKLVNVAFDIVDELTFGHRPVDICLVRTNVVAVTLWGQNLYFVVTSPFLAQCKSVKMKHDCRSVAFFNDELYITDRDKHVHVYDVTGTKHIRTVRKGLFGSNAFSCSSEIVMSKDGSNFFVADLRKGLICFRQNGHFLWNVTHSSLLEPWGVCVDDDDNVFICCFRSENVVQFNSSGKMLGTVMGKDDGLVKPQSVFYDPYRNRLLVTLYEQNHLFVISFK